MVIDNYNRPAKPGTEYTHFVGTMDGYDIYYVKADLALSRIPISPKDTLDMVLRLDFDLPPFFEWGNWLSVRREFQDPLDLSRYKELILNVKVEVPVTDAFLRITLSDLTGDVNKGDEMWWFDCSRDLLKNTDQKWIEVHIPLDGLRISYGAGTRHNDYKLNLSRIVAYEIDIISESRVNQKGVILVDFLRARE